jgi:hypothetical protein
MCLLDNGNTMLIIDNNFFMGRGAPFLAVLLIAKYHFLVIVITI